MGFHCQGLSKSYATRNGPIEALRDVTFKVAAEEFVCIVGPSGCGKTTLLKLVAGLARPTSGCIVFDSDPNVPAPPRALVFQEHGLFPWMTLLDNVAFGLKMRGMGRRERNERARVFVDKFGLAGFADSFPHELSVGMSQRVAIARAFVSDPGILLMDEPFGSLDVQTKWVLEDELMRIWREHRKMVVYVTHDIEEAVLLGDRVLVMSGRPGTIRAEVPIPLARPRELRDRDRPEVVEWTWQIWRMLEDEVRKSLRAPS